MYLYASSSNSFPLIQFFAFYQSIEVFFPTFTHREIRRRVSSVLKSPTFSPDNNRNLDQLMAIINGRKNGGYLDEKDQLKEILSVCVPYADLYSIIEDEGLKNIMKARIAIVNFQKYK